MRNYLVEQGYVGKRNANYDRCKAINKLFVVATEDEMNGYTSGNVEGDLIVNKETKTCSFEKLYPRDKDSLYFSSVISSSLLLYRLICTFPETKIQCYGKDGYKMVWQYSVKHVETGNVITFDEWKGAATFHTIFQSYKNMPESLQKDLLELINYLISDECAHPYDRLVAGGVA